MANTPTLPLPPSDTLERREAIARNPCTVPPRGWWCSREAGHEGPCAAREDNDLIARIERLAAWAADCGFHVHVTTCALAIEALSLPAREVERNSFGDWVANTLATTHAPREKLEADLVEAKKALADISAGAANGEAEFRRRMGTRSKATWHAVNALQEYLSAAGGHARATLNRLSGEG